MSNWQANHFEAIGAALAKSVREYGQTDQARDLADSFVAMFSATNKGFQPSRFYQAAGLGFRGVTITLNEVEQFFYDHAKAPDPDEDETMEHARACQAIQLALAERDLLDSPDTAVQWAEETVPATVTGLTSYSFFLYQEGRLNGSLHGIKVRGTPEGDPIRVRVVSAELALEYLD
jgi:hypothetical protein